MFLPRPWPCYQSVAAVIRDEPDELWLRKARNCQGQSQCQARQQPQGFRLEPAHLIPYNSLKSSRLESDYAAALLEEGCERPEHGVDKASETTLQSCTTLPVGHA